MPTKTPTTRSEHLEEYFDAGGTVEQLMEAEDEHRHFQARLAAKDARNATDLIEKIRYNRDAQLNRAAEIIDEAGGPGSPLPQKVYDDWYSCIRRAEQYDAQADRLVKIQQERRNTAASIKVYEGRTYEKGGPHSYFKDIAVRGTNDSTAPGYNAAVQRLAKHDVETSYEIAQRSAEGKQALAVLRDSMRGHVQDIEVVKKAERRAASTSSLAGFSTPVYLLEEFATYRSAVGSFAQEARNLPLPDYGMEIFIPAFDSPSSVGFQSYENEGVDYEDPTGGYLSNSVGTFAGTVSVSQELQDRGGFADSSFDTFLVEQMKSQLQASVDLYVVNQALSNAGTVTESTALTASLFWQNINAAKAQLADTAGTRLLGSHVFATADFYEWLEALVDSDGRPLFTADSGAILQQPPVGSPVNGTTWRGYHLTDLCAYSDDNVPASFGQPTWEQVIVASMQHVLVFSGQPVTFAYPETEATSLSVAVGLRQYVSSLPRYPMAVSVISGAGYANLS